MKKPKYTPGPWAVGRYPNDPNSYVVTTDQTVCTTDQGYYDNVVDMDQCAANAELIAAAPEMIDVLENVLSHFKATGLSPEEHELNTLIYSIIKKAKGD